MEAIASKFVVGVKIFHGSLYGELLPRDFDGWRRDVYLDVFFFGL